MSVAVRHYIYRCYDIDGRLLYVGCTAHIAPRMSQHRQSTTSKASRWLQVSMDRYEVSPLRFPTKQDGRDAEAKAIMDEHPLFNVQGRRIPMWQIHGAVAEYLIRRGHADLAIETTCTCEPDFVCYTHELAAEWSDAITTRRAQADEVAA